MREPEVVSVSGAIVGSTLDKVVYCALSVAGFLYQSAWATRLLGDWLAICALCCLYAVVKGWPSLNWLKQDGCYSKWLLHDAVFSAWYYMALAAFALWHGYSLTSIGFSVVSFSSIIKAEQIRKVNKEAEC